MDDEELVRRIQGGERGRLAELTTRYVGPLFDFFRRNGVPSNDAEDLVQETILQCIASLGAFRGKSSFRTWLFRMAKNRMVDRSRRPRWKELTRDDVEGVVAMPARSRDVDRVRAAMERLIPSRREVLRLFHEEGLACEEIAKRQGKRVESVWKDLSRAYADLRSLLAGEEDHAEE